MTNSLTLRTRFMLCWAAALLCLAPSLASASIAVVAAEGPAPMVVSSDDPFDQKSAEELCKYLSRVTGRAIEPNVEVADATVVIHVGRDAFVLEHAPEIEQLFADGFIIKHVTAQGREHVIIAGRQAPSTQWAVERFIMDYCGVRWLFPDPVYGEVVPNRPTVTISRGLSKKYEPHYISRGNVGMYNPSHSGIGRLGAHSYQYGAHQIQWMFTAKEYETNPEWFAFFTISERRFDQYFTGKLPADAPRRGRWHWDYGNGWQICSTNPETVTHAVQWVREFFEKHPSYPVVSVGNNDGWGECECPTCEAYLKSATPAHTVSERWWQWVNQVAKEVAKTHPDKWIESLAYSQTSAPPRFQLEPNVAVTKTIVLDSELALAEQWRTVCQSVNLYSYVWGGHVMGFRHYPKAMQDFLKWGHYELGALAHAPENLGNWTLDGAKYHYIQALQWNVDADMEALMDEFCQVSYGLAAAPMRAFWDRHETVWENREPTAYGKTGTRLLFYQWPAWSDAAYLPPNHEFECYDLTDIAFLDERIAEAVRLAGEDGKEARFRVERAADAWKLVRTMAVSKLKYYDEPRIGPVDSQEAMTQTMARARELADLRADRAKYLGKLRQVPHIDPHIYSENYWAMPWAYTIFSHEETMLDELCTAVSRRLVQTEGQDAARRFWEAVSPTDNLHKAAQTQLYELAHPARPNLLLNGDFATGTLAGWDSSGTVDVVAGDDIGGRFVARMQNENASFSQSVAVKPLGRYRLTAWVRYTTQPAKGLVPAEIRPVFYSGARPYYWAEPLRAMLPDTSGEWTPFSITMTATPGADRVHITFTNKPAATVQWGKITVEEILPGPDARPDYLFDDFSADRIDDNRWVRGPTSAGFNPPQVREGWLTSVENMHAIISLASFNDLLSYTDDARYRLRFHTRGPVSWAIQNGAGRITTKGTGPYFGYTTGPNPGDAPRFMCNAYQSGSLSGSARHTISHLAGNEEAWFILYFDPEFITVYASGDGYDDSQASLVGKFPHGITNLAANGNVYLKLDGVTQLNQISLISPGHEAKQPAAPVQHDQIYDVPELH